MRIGTWFTELRNWPIIWPALGHSIFRECQRRSGWQIKIFHYKADAIIRGGKLVLCCDAIRLGLVSVPLDYPPISLSI